MDTDAEEIWNQRLRKDVDVIKIKDTQTLLDEIDKTPDSYVSKKGKIVDLTQAKENLKKNVKDLFSGSNSLREDVYNNNISDLKEATTKEDVNNIENIFTNIPNIDFDRKQLFSGEVAIRERELLKEKGIEGITREDILSSPRRKISKFSQDFGITQDEAREVVVREGFTLSEDGKSFKK